MTEKTIQTVLDDIKPWSNNYGTFYGVTAFFEDGDTLMTSKKKREWAEELHAILVDIVNEPMDFHLEDKGVSQGGSQKWNVKGIANIEGTVIYGKMADGSESVQGGVVASSAGGAGRTRPPEHDVDASIRAAVALKAAASFSIQENLDYCLYVAEQFDAWLAKKASEPASSAYPVSSEGDSNRTADDQAVAGSEQTSPQSSSVVTGVSREAESLPPTAGDTQSAVSAADGGSGLGEGPAPPEHIHDYQIRQGVKGFLVCECGKTTKKATA